MEELQNCKLCNHAHCCSAEVYDNDAEWFAHNSQDWYCAHPSLLNDITDTDIQEGTKAIEFYVEEHEKVETPKWCPRLKLLNNLKVEEPSQTKNTVKVRRSTYERNQVLKTVKGLNDWNSLEIGKIYHLPPVSTEKRKDYYLLKKENWSIIAREVNLATNTLGAIRYIYSTSDWSKFLVENKMHECDLSKLEAQAKELESSYYSGYEYYD